MAVPAHTTNIALQDHHCIIPNHIDDVVRTHLSGVGNSAPRPPHTQTHTPNILLGCARTNARFRGKYYVACKLRALQDSSSVPQLGNLRQLECGGTPVE